MASKDKDLTSTRNIAENTAWIFIEKIVGSVLSILVGAWVARYLGPDQLGVLSLAVAISGVTMIFTKRGLDSIIVKKLIENSETRRHLLANIVIAQTRSGLVGYLLIGVFAYTVDDRSFQLVLLILGARLVDYFGSVYRLFFEAKLDLKKVVIAGTVLSVITSIVRIVLVELECELWTFAAALTLSQFIHSALVYAIALPLLKDQEPSANDPALRKGLLQEALPLLFTGLVGFLYMTLDRLMLGWISGTEEVGLYSVANTIAVFLFFIPTSLVKSLVPGLADSKKRNGKLTKSAVESSTAILATIGIASATLMAISSTHVINILYGAQFANSGLILLILSFAVIPVSIGRLRNYLLILLDKQKIVLWCNCMGLAVNVVLNLILIPHIGGYGAALATTTSLFIAMWFAGFMFRDVRALTIQQSKTTLLTLTPYGLYKTYNHIKSRLGSR